MPPVFGSWSCAHMMMDDRPMLLPDLLTPTTTEWARVQLVQGVGLLAGGRRYGELITQYRASLYSYRYSTKSIR